MVLKVNYTVIYFAFDKRFFISENGLNEEGQMCEDILNLIADI